MKKALYNASNVTQEIYEACNKYYWFTSGTNEEYNALFDFIRKHADSEHIDDEFSFNWFCKQITIRIAEHTTNTDKQSIMFIVARAIAPYYFEYDE